MSPLLSHALLFLSHRLYQAPVSGMIIGLPNLSANSV
jgi:hypothetical protein